MFSQGFSWTATWLCVFLIGALLGGCKFYPDASTSKKPAAKVSNSTATGFGAQLGSRQKTVQRLLADADYALSQNRLLTPLEDNAFDRFQTVLLLEPGNKSAKTGLQAIALRYIELARNSIGRGQYSQAQTYISNARSIDPSSPLLAETTAYLQRQKAVQPPAQSYKAGANEHLLDAKELTLKSPKIITRLTQLAQQAKDSGDLVMIYARNDAEGRWIYAQMRGALEDFLLRGDIRIAPQPRIQFVPVL